MLKLSFSQKKSVDAGRNDIMAAVRLWVDKPMLDLAYLGVITHVNRVVVVEVAC